MLRRLLTLAITASLFTLSGCVQTPVKVSAAEAPAIVQPAPNVPPACAAFIGGWVGEWSRGNIGHRPLWVTEVGADCLATYTYSRVRGKAKVENGALSFICNLDTNGTCVFKRSGDNLWASYSNPGGGTNSATFAPIQIAK